MQSLRSNKTCTKHTQYLHTKKYQTSAALQSIALQSKQTIKQASSWSDVCIPVYWLWKFNSHYILNGWLSAYCIVDITSHFQYIHTCSLQFCNNSFSLFLLRFSLSFSFFDKIEQSSQVIFFLIFTINTIDFKTLFKSVFSIVSNLIINVLIPAWRTYTRDKRHPWVFLVKFSLLAKIKIKKKNQRGKREILFSKQRVNYFH